MKKALIFAFVLSFLFIFVSLPCSGCKQHKPAATNNDNVSESADSDIESEASDDPIVDNSVIDESKDSNLKEDSESNEALNDNASDRVSIVESNANNAIVIVEGAGETLEQAKRDALRCAVEEVVGSLVDAQSRVENDELIEQILTASSAYVEKYTVLSRKIENGLATVKIRATVVKTSLTKKLKLSEGGQTVVIDGASLAGKASTKTESEKNGALFLANFLRKEEFPYRLIDVKIVGQPKVVQTGNEIAYTLTWEISVNRERYMDFVKRLQPILDKCALRKSSFVLDLEKIIKNDDDDDLFFDPAESPPEMLTNDKASFNWSYKQVNKLADEPNIQFYLCTGIISDFRSLKYESYELPQKYKIPIQYYGRILPTVNIALLNSNSEEIAIKRIVTYINLCPHLRGNLCFDNSDEAGESLLGNISVHEGINWLSISPFGGHNLNCYYKHTYTTRFTISSEELAQVKSATIFVISNNPEMDKAFERMEEEIDQVPTN